MTSRVTIFTKPNDRPESKSPLPARPSMNDATPSHGVAVPANHYREAAPQVFAQANTPPFPTPRCPSPLLVKTVACAQGNQPASLEVSPPAMSTPGSGFRSESRSWRPSLQSRSPGAAPDFRLSQMPPPDAGLAPDVQRRGASPRIPSPMPRARSFAKPHGNSALGPPVWEGLATPSTPMMQNRAVRPVMSVRQEHVAPGNAVVVGVARTQLPCPPAMVPASHVPANQVIVPTPALQPAQAREVIALQRVNSFVPAAEVSGSMRAYGPAPPRAASFVHIAPGRCDGPVLYKTVTHANNSNSLPVFVHRPVEAHSLYPRGSVDISKINSFTSMRSATSFVHEPLMASIRSQQATCVGDDISYQTRLFMMQRAVAEASAV